MQQISSRHVRLQIGSAGQGAVMRYRAAPDLSQISQAPARRFSDNLAFALPGNRSRRDYLEIARARHRIEARHRARGLSLAILSGMAAALLCASLWALAPDHKLSRPVALVAVDASGEMWIAGSGDDCVAAAIDAKIPDNVVSLSCQESR